MSAWWHQCTNNLPILKLQEPPRDNKHQHGIAPNLCICPASVDVSDVWRSYAHLKKFRLLKDCCWCFVGEKMLHGVRKDPERSQDRLLAIASNILNFEARPRQRHVTSILAFDLTCNKEIRLI